MNLYRMIFILFNLLTVSICGFDRSPWFGNLWEWTSTSAYIYSHYRNIQNGSPQLERSSNDQGLLCDLTVVPSPVWQVSLELGFADTPRQSMGYRSSALQLRYLWLNDLLGDCVSWTMGAGIRGVSKHSLKDVSSPYHSNTNFEINTAVGREWDHEFAWIIRLFGGTSMGVATQGYPWISGFAVVEGQINQAHRISFLFDGELGFGNRKKVFINHFDGYAFIQHRNIDLGIQYAYAFEIWGQVSISYARRVYARAFPQHVNFVTISYALPFSLF